MAIPEFVGGWGGDPLNSEEYTKPAFMFNTGMIVIQTQNQSNVFETPKNTQVVHTPNFNHVDAGNARNDGGWM